MANGEKTGLMLPMVMRADAANSREPRLRNAPVPPAQRLQDTDSAAEFRSAEALTSAACFGHFEMPVAFCHFCASNFMPVAERYSMRRRCCAEIMHYQR